MEEEEFIIPDRDFAEDFEVADTIQAQELFSELKEEWLPNAEKLKNIKDDKLCKACGNVLPEGKRKNMIFCDRGCYIVWRNLQHAYICHACRKKFIMKLCNRSNVKKKPVAKRFCSRECFIRWSKIALPNPFLR